MCNSLYRLQSMTGWSPGDHLLLTGAAGDGWASGVNFLVEALLSHSEDQEFQAAREVVAQPLSWVEQSASVMSLNTSRRSSHATPPLLPLQPCDWHVEAALGW
jgi:hypothetical protein